MAGKKKKKGNDVKKEQLQAAAKKRNYILGGVLVLVLVAAAVIWAHPWQTTPQEAAQAPKVTQNATPPQTRKPSSDVPVAATQDYTIQTAKGNIVIQVYPKLMPITVANFAKLVSMRFYNGLTFHRVNSWLIQGGDPNGNGTGGPGWTIKFETNPRLTNVRGAVGMARLPNNLNSAGSQFYILKADAPSLNGQYAVFGKVIKGMSVVDKIAKGDRMISIKPGA
ncbi:MAG: peptidylprolyl isomerase [Peptococcaceae bacterium]|nr:peptidylprolyl isomerase [Peptococcaceae bacterium]